MIFKESGLKFAHYFDMVKGQFKDLQELSKESNDELFLLKRKETDKFKRININDIQIGRFYLINYNFNGNKLYCPILTIDYRVSGNKHILYALNLDYLPIGYKRLYFNQFYNTFKQIFDFNNDVEDVSTEKTLPINFEQIYKSLKDNGDFQYAITAFDILKIKECNLVSTDLIHTLLFSHMRNINIKLMKDNMDNYENDEYKKSKLKYTISELEKLQEDYNKDIVTYYKKLKQLESNYKLFENE